MNNGKTNGDGAVRQLNSLLRGEISAAETYKMAMDKIGSDEADLHMSEMVRTLRDLQEDHGRAAQALRRRIESLGAEAADASGAWGVYAKAVQGAADLFGNASALKSLKEGEEHGLKDLREAVDDVDEVTAGLIRNQLIPQQWRHISMLDRLIGAAHAA